MSTTHERLPLINEGFTFKKAGERITHSEWNAVLETFAKCYNNLVLDTDETANAVLTALAGKSEQGHAHNTTDINGLSSLITRMIASIDLSEYVTNKALNTKVSEALAHAKDSGQFNGASATHKWNGTVLTVTSASGTSSADLKGEKGDKGDKGDKGEQGIQGETGAKGDKGDTGEQGPKGDKGDKGDKGNDGADGKDGKDGADYILTDDDKSEIAAQVSGDCVSYSEAQALTDEQKKMARENIGVNTTVSVTDDGYGNIALNIKGAGMDVTFTDDGNGNIKMEAM